MSKVTRITASNMLDFEFILRLLMAFRLVQVENIWKCRASQAIIVALSIEKVEVVLRQYLGSSDYPYRSFQLETREEWDSVSQVP